MRHSFTAFVGLLCCLLALPAAGADQPKPLSTEELAKIITGVPDHRAQFHETRRLTMLSEPLELEGTLLFRGPDHLEKHTDAPQRETMVADGEWISVNSPEHRNSLRFNIADDPVLHGLLFSLRSLLNGEPQRLSELFDVEAWGGSDEWILRLKPRASALAERIRAVRVQGEDRWLRKIELWETSGDYVAMTIDSEEPE